MFIIKSILFIILLIIGLVFITANNNNYITINLGFGLDPIENVPLYVCVSIFFIAGMITNIIYMIKTYQNIIMRTTQSSKKIAPTIAHSPIHTTQLPKKKNTKKIKPHKKTQHTINTVQSIDFSHENENEYTDL